jgi:hypothetical protein
MARVRYSIVSDALRGRVGGVVYRGLYGRKYVSSRPNPTEKPPTPNKLAQRGEFAAAAEYARGAGNDPNKRLTYEQVARPQGMSAYVAAILDWFQPPEVKQIIADNYQRAVGDVIMIHARDDAHVASVRVVIYLVDGRVVEQGEAVAQTSRLWRYVATMAGPADTPLFIAATATDWPGNTATKTQQLL